MTRRDRDELAPVACEKLLDGTWLARKAGFVGAGSTKIDAVLDVRGKVRLHHARPGEEWMVRAVDDALRRLRGAGDP